MKLVKLVYLLDRLSIEKRNIPVVGGDYLSMRNGPATSEVLDLINAGKLADEDDSLVPVMFRLVLGRCVAPDLALRVDVAWSQLAHFTGPAANEPLKSNHIRHDVG